MCISEMAISEMSVSNIFFMKFYDRRSHSKEWLLLCRGERIRTFDPLLPKQVR